MTLGLVGKKIGMTREFFDSGISIPVTVVKVEKGRVIDIYTKEKNGYSAVKLGFVKLKNSKLTNQMKGFFAKKNTEPKKIIKEYRVEKPEEFKAGNEVGLETFKDVKFIDVRSETIGKYTFPYRRKSVCRERGIVHIAIGLESLSRSSKR